MKRDYPELEGKTVEFFNELKTYTGIVAGVNYDIGISIDNIKNKEEHLICIHGPMFSKNDPSRSNYCPESYDAEFTAIVQGIKNGYLSLKAIHEVEFKAAGRNYDNDDYIGSVGTCAFSS